MLNRTLLAAAFLASAVPSAQLAAQQGGAGLPERIQASRSGRSSDQ